MTALISSRLGRFLALRRQDGDAALDNAVGRQRRARRG